MATITSDKDWKALVSHLPADLERLARDHRVLNPQWPNAKVTDAQTLLRLILLHVGADLPLRQTVAVIAKAAKKHHVASSNRPAYHMTFICPMWSQCHG